jgi:hypothetical protein
MAGDRPAVAGDGPGRARAAGHHPGHARMGPGRHDREQQARRAGRRRARDHDRRLQRHAADAGHPRYADAGLRHAAGRRLRHQAHGADGQRRVRAQRTGHHAARHTELPDAGNPQLRRPGPARRPAGHAHGHADAHAAGADARTRIRRARSTPRRCSRASRTSSTRACPAARASMPRWNRRSGTARAAAKPRWAPRTRRRSRARTKRWASTCRPGRFAAQLRAAQQDTVNRISSLSRDISIKQADLEQANLEKTIAAGMELEGKLIDYSYNMERLAFETAKEVADNAIAVHNAGVEKYKRAARLLPRVPRGLPGAHRGRKAQARRVPGLLQAEQTKADVNRTLVEQFKAQIEARSRSFACSKAAAGARRCCSKSSRPRSPRSARKCAPMPPA